MSPLTIVLLVGCYVASSSAQCLTGNDSPALMNPDSKNMMTNARIGFALDALRKASLIEPDDNLFFSPHSIHQAITLAYFGARGTTESSLKKALHIPEELSKVDVQRSYSLEKSLHQQKKEQGTEPTSYEYNSANRLWISQTKKVRECMLDLFSNELEKTDFAADPLAARNRINEWVSNTTKGHIKDLLPVDGVSADTDLVLANAVYFKGLWTSRFDKTNSKRDIFYGTTSNLVTFMRQKGTFNHIISEQLGAHILQLPYKGDDISMFILLPPFAMSRSLNESGKQQNSTIDRDGIHQLIERITKTKAGTEELLQNLNDGMPPREVEVSLPRFTIEKELQLAPLLHALGAGDLVTADKADLRGFLADGEGNLHLGDAVHRAKVDVNEEGTTAAAATALFSFRSSRPAEPEVFNANHPFLYIIYDRTNREILFTGVYRTPTTPSEPESS
ncbi:serine protease inhibitor 88Ea-like [Venturia canescens]|uniref:serine protease inhibitor 88Ea-like n=1 Tax=Venturia canescens TaxID=32260 RepID=UPI001C9BD762|nr:serine protease inhibitor 88Ea-like [Venturia canescens]XP_043283993.1 serine protease inhibitor 88Ea-like [Venturia canescens]